MHQTLRGIRNFWIVLIKKRRDIQFLKLRDGSTTRGSYETNGREKRTSCRVVLTFPNSRSADGVVFDSSVTVFISGNSNFTLLPRLSQEKETRVNSLKSFPPLFFLSFLPPFFFSYEISILSSGWFFLPLPSLRWDEYGWKWREVARRARNNMFFQGTWRVREIG